MKRITLIFMALLLLCMPLTLAAAAYDGFYEEGDDYVPTSYSEFDTFGVPITDEYSLLYSDEEGGYDYRLEGGYLTFQIQQTDYFTGEPTVRNTMPLPLSESMLEKLETTPLLDMCTVDTYFDYLAITQPNAIDTTYIRAAGTVEYVMPYAEDALLVLSDGAGNHSLCVATQVMGSEYRLQQSGIIPSGIEIDTFHSGESAVILKTEELSWSKPDDYYAEFKRGTDGTWRLVSFNCQEYSISADDGIVWCLQSGSDERIQLTGSLENITLTSFDFSNIPLTLDAFRNLM